MRARSLVFIALLIVGLAAPERSVAQDSTSVPGAITFIALHMASVLHGVETTVTLPPHY